MRIPGPYVLVRRKTRPNPTSVIEVIQFDAEPSQFAEVVIVGNERLSNRTSRPLDVLPGQTVILKRYTGTTITHNGESLDLVPWEDVLATVE